MTVLRPERQRIQLAEPDELPVVVENHAWALQQALLHATYPELIRAATAEHRREREVQNDVASIVFISRGVGGREVGLELVVLRQDGLSQPAELDAVIRRRLIIEPEVGVRSGELREARIRRR